MATLLEAQQIPPQPEHTPPREGDAVSDKKTYIARAWAEWFNRIRVKINLINESIANLSGLPESDDGILVKSGGNWFVRTIRGQSGQIVVTDGDGLAGDPLIELADVPDAAGGSLQAFARDSKGRVVGTRDATITGTPGRVTVSNGDAVTGPPTIDIEDTALGVLSVGAGFGIDIDNTDPQHPIVSSLPPTVTLSAASAMTGVQNGQTVIITDLSGGGEPCWYDNSIPSGVKWRRYSDRSIAS